MNDGMCEEIVAQAVGAENVRRLLDGELTGAPLPGTLADRVFDALTDRMVDRWAWSGT
jgi:hypothetical protein